MSRCRSVQHAIPTPFGKMYVHIEIDDAGIPIGAWISDPLKDKETPVTELVQSLSAGFHDALKALHRESTSVTGRG